MTIPEVLSIAAIRAMLDATRCRHTLRRRFTRRRLQRYAAAAYAATAIDYCRCAMRVLLSIRCRFRATRPLPIADSSLLPQVVSRYTLYDAALLPTYNCFAARSIFLIAIDAAVCPPPRRRLRSAYAAASPA